MRKLGMKVLKANHQLFKIQSASDKIEQYFTDNAVKMCNLGIKALKANQQRFRDYKEALEDL